MEAKNINELIEILDQIIKTSKQDKSPLGYFAALYKRVTQEVKRKLGTGYFDDDERMERLDVVFANRYLKAYSDYLTNLPITRSWKTTFEHAKENRLIVLQHLVLGMNAHINLDLGIVASEVSPGNSIISLQNDFNKINEILSSLVNEVQEDLSKVWPTLRWILKVSKGIDDFMVDFSMKLARNGAWKFANEIALLPTEQKDILINSRDIQINNLANKITNYGFLLRIIFWIIRFTEKGDVAKKITDLES